MILVALTLLATVAASAQTVQGTLIGEKSHHPIGNAHVTLVDDSGHVAAAATTDSASGTFYLTALGKGQYRVTVLVGHGGVTNTPLFQLDSDQTVERTIVAPDWPIAYLNAFLPDDVTTPARLTPHQSPRWPRSCAGGNSGGERSGFSAHSFEHSGDQGDH